MKIFSIFLYYLKLPIPFDLIPYFQEGDYYLSVQGSFYIIKWKEFIYHKTSDLSKCSDGCNLIQGVLYERIKDAMYFWGTQSRIYFVKPEEPCQIHCQRIVLHLESVDVDEEN